MKTQIYNNNSKVPGDHHLLSPGHAEYGLLRLGHLQCLPSQQCSKAGLCPCSKPVQDFLLDAAPVCLCRLYRRCLRADEVRQQTLARLRAKTKAYAVLIRCCFNIPQQGGPPTSRRQAVPHLQGVWANDQPQEDQHPGTRCCVPRSHHHRQHGAGGCGHLHLLGLHRVKHHFAQC